MAVDIDHAQGTDGALHDLEIPEDVADIRRKTSRAKPGIRQSFLSRCQYGSHGPSSVVEFCAEGILPSVNPNSPEILTITGCGIRDLNHICKSDPIDQNQRAMFHSQSTMIPVTREQWDKKEGRSNLPPYLFPRSFVKTI